MQKSDQLITLSTACEFKSDWKNPRASDAGCVHGIPTAIQHTLSLHGPVVA